ncbi:MAG: hypothetical protein R2802_00350 [Flavobacteriaceae bacterium]
MVLPPIVNAPTPLYACDSNNDGFASFDLLLKKDEIFSNQGEVYIFGGGYLLGFFETEQDAQNGTNPIPYSEYENYNNITAFQQTIYIAVYVDTNLGASCINTTSLDLITVDTSVCNNADFFTMTPISR